MSFFNLITTGDIAGEDFCYHKIPEELDPYDFEAFERSGTEFYVGCSNVDTGKPEYIWTGEAAAVIFLRRPILSWFQEDCHAILVSGSPSFRKSGLAWEQRRTAPGTGNTIMQQPCPPH